MLSRSITLAMLSSLTLSIVPGVLAVADQQPAQHIVVLLHGLGRTRWSMACLETALSEQGYHVVNIGYPSTREPIEQLAERLDTALAQCCKKRGARVHFVTHSLGGILVRFYLTKYPLNTVGRVVMLSPPNHGSELVDVFQDSFVFRLVFGPAWRQLGTQPSSIPNQLGPVDFELGVITGDRSFNPLSSWLIPGKDDGKVSVESAKVTGMADFLVVPHTHTFIMNSRTVREQILHFLKTGTFYANEG